MLTNTYPLRVVPLDLPYSFYAIRTAVKCKWFCYAAIVIDYGSGRSGYASAHRGQDQGQR
jgi:hypothetical protein